MILSLAWLPSVGQAVIAPWLLLWLGGHWKPEPSWIDRLGRVLGWGWLAGVLMNWA